MIAMSTEQIAAPVGKTSSLSDKDLLKAFEKSSMQVLVFMGSDITLFSSQRREQLYSENAELKREIFNRVEAGIWQP